MDEAPEFQIKIEDVSLAYARAKQDPFLALSGIGLKIRPNTFVSIIGPSGCGKSTLLKVISRVVPVTRGTVLIDDVPVERAPLAGALSFMFQQPLLLPWRNVTRNVLLPLEIRHRRLTAAMRDRVQQLLTTVGLEHAGELYPHQLSGGMKQRVALARALVTDPKILLMDEPFGAVDEITRESLQDELLRIWEFQRTTIVMVTHSVEEAALLSDQIVVMSSAPGQIRRIVDVPMPRPRGSSMRQTAEFHQLMNMLRDLLQSDPTTTEEAA